MKKLILSTGVAVLAGCMVTTVSKDYSVGEVENGEKLSYKHVDNLDDIESYDKSAIPVVVKAEKKEEQLYSPAGIHGLLWLCTLGIVPSWQDDAETYTISVSTPLGEKSGVCTVKKRQYVGWVPYMLPFASPEEDMQCEEELLSRIVSQYKKEWTAENVERMNAAKSERMKALRAKADSLLAKKDYMAVINICKSEKSRAFGSEYMPKAIELRRSVLKQEVEAALRSKDYQRVIDLCENEGNDAELESKRGEAIVCMIATCYDDTRLVELLKKYEKELSTEKLAEINKKTESDIVKTKLTEMCDNKIAMQMKDMCDKDEVNAKRFAELFANIRSLEIRSRVFREIMIPLMKRNVGVRGSGIDDFWAFMMNPLSTEEIVSFYEAIAVEEEEGTRKRIVHYLFRHCIPQSNLFNCYAAFIEKGIHPQFYSFGDRITEINDANLRKIMTVLGSKEPLDFYIASWMCENAQSTEIVEELFGKWKIGKQGDNAKVRSLLEMFAKKLGRETKEKILAEAKQKAIEMKGTKIVFGPFYVGMPYLDALLLGEELRIADGMVIYSNPSKESCGVRDYASVWRIDFGNRAKFKFVDCEDAAVLDQVIHQFVKGRSGKVSRFHYSEETRVEDDERIGICLGYSNTKLGTKVLFNNESGELSLVEI